MFAPTFSIKQSRCFLTYCSPIGLQYQPRLKAHNERRQPHVASLFYLLILPSVGISGESSSSKSATFLNGSSYSLKLNWSHIWSFTSRSLMYLFIASAVSFCKKLQLFFSANASYCRARSGLAAPSCCPCRAHSSNPQGGTLGIVVIWRLFTDSEKSSLRKGLGPPS